MIYINLAVEDELSESVTRQILGSVGRYCVVTCYRKGGYGYLKQTIAGWNNASRGTPFLVLTDLDSYSCPSALIADWFRELKLSKNLLFRVAVREVEAWLLADRMNLARFLSVSQAVVPHGVDSLSDPKQSLINLARRSRKRELRERIVPVEGGTAIQGPDYNTALTEFVTSTWDVNVAASESPSLRRAVQALAGFNPR